MKFKLIVLLIYFFIPFNFCSQEELNNKSYLLANLDRNIKKIYSTDTGNATEELITNLPIELDEINDFTFSNRHNEIYLHQSNRSGIIKFNLTDQEYQIIHDQNTSSISFLTYDDFTNNLYWLNNINNNLELGSIDGKIRSTVLENFKNPISLVFYSERKELFVGLTGEQSSILVINLLDKHTDKIVNSNISKPNTLTIDKENNLLYWSDAELGTIESISINDPTIRKNILSNLGQIESLVFKDQMLYWTDLKTSNLYMLNLNDKSKTVMVGSIGDNINLFKKLIVVDNRSNKLFTNNDIDELDDFNSNDDDENRSFKRSMYLNPYTDKAFIDKYSYIYRQFEPPNIQIDIDKFSHSTVRSTEDDNREDIFINQISEINFPMNFYSKPIAWHYERFNSSNYLMVDQEQMITIWREPIFNGHIFKFNNPICQIDLRNKGIPIQSIFYTRTINYEQVLQFAFIYRSSSNGYKLRSYEITGDSRCLPIYLFDLKNHKPIKLDFISTYQFGSLAVLFEHQKFEPHIEYLKSEHEISTKLVKIYAKQAVDFESFIANGFAYLAIGHLNGVDIFKFNELISHHRHYESIAIYNIKDLKSFSIGFKNFLAIATGSNYQHIFTWKSGSLLRYQILNITNVLQWQIIGLQTCRDDLLLGVIRNDNVYPFQLYTWDGVNKHFQLAIENIHQYTSHDFIINPFSLTSFNYNSTAYILEFDRGLKPRLLAIHTSLRQIIDPVFKKLQIVSSKIKSLYNNFVYQQKDINYIKNILDSAVRSTYTVIDANQKFLNNVDIGKSININVITKMRRVKII